MRFDSGVRVYLAETMSANPVPGHYCAVEFGRMTAVNLTWVKNVPNRLPGCTGSPGVIDQISIGCREASLCAMADMLDQEVME